jgi:hypothetical protein
VKTGPTKVLHAESASYDRFLAAAIVVIFLLNFHGLHFGQYTESDVRAGCNMLLTGIAVFTVRSLWKENMSRLRKLWAAAVFVFFLLLALGWLGEVRAVCDISLILLAFSFIIDEREDYLSRFDVREDYLSRLRASHAVAPHQC